MQQSIISKTEAHVRGKTRYFTGQPCKHGHLTERYVSSLGCIACLESRDSPEKKRVRNRARYVANREAINARLREWRLSHPEEFAAMHALSEARRRGAVVPAGLGYRDFTTLYTEARRLSQETGIRHEVDHKRPIKCAGTHEPANLQVLTLAENRRKGAKWSPD